MNAMQNAFNAVGCILLLGSVGAGAYLLGLLRDEHLPLLSALVIKVALPGRRSICSGGCETSTCRCFRIWSSKWRCPA